ncbi:peptidyl-prolyl cis-trans isomerase [Thermaerobacillus caldiproteolyticus]|uniref:Peptidyl-prolyl cis-trans isomerase n=1 Tax=Thermaerobacillus caldiproteolyticus TaxID=247480 RepID=A0A7V9Z4Z3_9BACL|nr:peptidyl-prolyl cis-trans isomerase [Anoxybacillus caldiproteolyticus]MBA2874129.1 hypothetical protein [Anoxybacillus caldiproteolyticus]QPA31920.1 peptidyl-prolyl cis-trans isomerase [Anoxybacillus caldiproteolyticus]
MDYIIPITGKVKFSITLDPGVWIFDDRKVDLLTYFSGQSEEEPQEEDEIKKISAYWDREIQEGAVSPPTLKTEKRFAKEKIITGTFAMPLVPFLRNAEPLPEATTLTIVTEHEEITIPLEQAYEAILGFSKDGKPLKEDGPVHFYFGDGSNREKPITHVRQFIVG